MMNDNQISTKTIFGSVNQRRENIRYEFKSRNGKIWEVMIHPWWPMAVWWLGWGEVGLAHHLLWWHIWSLFFLSWIWVSDLNWSEGMIPIFTIMPYQTIAFTTLTFIDNWVQVPYLTFICVIFRAMCPFALLVVELTC